MDSDAEESIDTVVEQVPAKVTNGKFGIVYLSYIPEGLNVKIIREIMSQFGEVGRIYMEPEKKGKKRLTYLEGWVEFSKKRVAKLAAKSLNGTPLEYGRKRCKMNGQMWSVKYLHKFKWAHLKEQLSLDKAVKEQKRKFEMTQAKKQVDFYQKMTERSKRLRPRKEDSSNNDPQLEDRIKTLEKRQNRPLVQGEELNVNVDEELLTSIFKRVD